MPSDFPTSDQLNQQTEMLKRISQAKYANVGNQMINSNFPSGMGLNPQEQMPAQEQVTNAPQRSRSVIPLENVMDREPPPAGLSQYGGTKQPSFGGINQPSVDRPKMSESELKDMVRRQQAKSPNGGLPVSKIPAMAPLMLESETGVSVRATPMSGGKYRQIEAGVTIPFAGGDLSIDGSYGRVQGKYKDKPEISRHIEYVRKFAAGGIVDTQTQINSLMASGGLALAKGGDVSPLSGGMNIHNKMRDEFAKRGLDFDGFLSTKAEARAAAEKLKSMGNNGDTILAHINPREAALLKEHGGSGTINPRTGLLQFGDGEGGSGGRGDGGSGSANDGGGTSDRGGGDNSGGGQGSGSGAAGGGQGGGQGSDPGGTGDLGGGGGGVSDVGGSTGGGGQGSGGKGNEGGSGGGQGGGPGGIGGGGPGETGFGGGIMGGAFGKGAEIGVSLGTEEQGPAAPAAPTAPTAQQVETALNSLAAALSAQQTALSVNNPAATKSGVAVAENEAETQAIETAMGMVGGKSPSAPSAPSAPSTPETPNASPETTTPNDSSIFDAVVSNPIGVSVAMAANQNATNPAVAALTDENAAATFGRSFSGIPGNIESYGYGPQHSFYAARGGVVSPLNQLRNK